MVQEGYLESCLGTACETSCCSRGYWEELVEFKKSPRKEVLDQLRDLGVTVDIREDRVEYSGCGGDACLLLENFPGDIRSLACKIFPYKQMTVRGFGEGDTVGIFIANCPATRRQIPPAFTDEVRQLVREHYRLVYDRDVRVIEVERPQTC